MKIVIAANTYWYIYNFRSNLIRKLTNLGHEVTAIALNDEYAGRVAALGASLADWRLRPSSVNPIREFASLIDAFRKIRAVCPDVVLSYTPKANIYFGVICRIQNVPFVPNVSGMGRLFSRDSKSFFFASYMLKVAFRRAYRVVIQNEDDQIELAKYRIVRREKCVRVPGSGVDLSKFLYTPVPMRAKGAAVFLFAARLIWDKGVVEFVSAASFVKQRYKEARFCIVGFLDTESKSGVPLEFLRDWESRGAIEYLGPTDDISSRIVEASCVVLPTKYREGVPRVLLEASASGRPIIATDTPGCREAVVDGVTGFLCDVGDPDDLAEKMQEILGMTAESLRDMGLAGRRHIEIQFDENIVLDAYLRILNELPGSPVQKYWVR